MSQAHDDRWVRELLAGIDVSRPLPAATRRALADTFAPRLPSETRTRLAATLAEPDAAVVSAALAGTDRPRPLPDDTRARLAAVLAGGAANPDHGPWHGTPTARRVLAAAAAIVLLVGVLAVAGGSGERSTEIVSPPTTGSSVPASTSVPSSAHPPSAPSAPTVAEPGVGSSGSSGGVPAPQSTGRTGATGGTSAGDAAGGVTSPAAGPAPASGPRVPFDGDDVASASSAPQIRVPVSVVGGSPDSPGRAGFAAYLDALARAGSGIEIVEVAAGDAVVVIDLGGEASASGDGRLALASAHTPASVLADTVVGAAGAVDRQARVAVEVLAADLGGLSGRRVAVYREPGGVYGTTVPDAVEEELRARGATVVPVVWRAGTPVLPPAEVAVVSLRDGLDSWLDAVGTEPSFSVVGLTPMADTGRRLPERAVVVSPYRLAAGAEETAVLERAGPISAERIHGWVTAKALARAVASTGSGDPARLLTALRAPQDLGFAPYDVRDGGNVRRPDGIVLRAGEGGLVAEGDFRDFTG